MGFLKGKTAIITGGGRAVLSDGSCGSIGYGIATAYAKEGANLVITGRNLQKLEDAKEELERLYGIQVLPVQADVNAGTDNEAAVANVVKQAIDTFGRIDELIMHRLLLLVSVLRTTQQNSSISHYILDYMPYSIT